MKLKFSAYFAKTQFQAMRFYFSFIFLLSASLAIGQFSDDFSDGDFSNPNWLGDVNHFIVNTDNQMQLNAPSAGSSLVYLETMVPDSSIWDLWLKMDFSPSMSNQLVIYLMSESSDFSTADAVFLELGENGNNDAIQIKQRLSGVESLLGSTPVASIASNPVTLHLNIEKKGDDWRLLVDYDGASNLAEAATWITPVNITGNKYFGLSCNYTATRIDKFFFDDISLTKWAPDTAPPMLFFAEAITAQEVSLHFDERLDPASLDVSHFTLSGNVMVADVSFGVGDSSKVTLFLSQDLDNGSSYTVTTTNVTDLHGNTGSGSVSFLYAVPENIAPFDIVFNELLADPTPSVGLPEKEFIELYNRSGKVLDLGDLTLQVNTTSRDLPNYSLAAGDFVLLVDEADTALWSPFGNVLGMDLPGLSNSGATLALMKNSVIIHQVNYNKQSYRNNEKDDGGWTLEAVNPENPCLGEGNWVASTSLQGGTPGKQNEVLDITFKNNTLEVVQVFPNTASDVTVKYNQIVGMNAADISNYSIIPDLGIISASSNLNTVVLEFGSPMKSGIVYEFKVLSGVTNCVNSLPSENQTFKLGLAEAPSSGDVVINEVLFNPVSGGSDYVELLNVSDKIIDIATLAIANTQKVGAIKVITSSGLLFPNQYVAFTPDRFQVVGHYDVPDTAWVVENLLPSFNDDEGNVSLVFNGDVIDSVNYDEEMHLDLVSDKNGVALERINPNGDSDKANNWISGASNVNYGTPGYKNGQFASGVISGSDYIQVRQKIFSPNGDGFEDFVLFDFELPASGYTLNGRVFSADGQYVNRLSNNDILGRTGTIRWDGVDDSGRGLSAGIYIVRFEFFQADGEKIVELETCGIVRE